MENAIFKAVINVLIALTGAVIIWLSVRKIDRLEKQVDELTLSDTTMVVVSDSIPYPFILPE